MTTPSTKQAKRGSLRPEIQATDSTWMGCTAKERSGERDSRGKAEAAAKDEDQDRSGGIRGDVREVEGYGMASEHLPQRPVHAVPEWKELHEMPAPDIRRAPEVEKPGQPRLLRTQALRHVVGVVPGEKRNPKARQVNRDGSQGNDNAWNGSVWERRCSSALIRAERNTEVRRGRRAPM